MTVVGCKVVGKDVGCCVVGEREGELVKGCVGKRVGEEEERLIDG